MFRSSFKVLAQIYPIYLVLLVLVPIILGFIIDPERGYGFYLVISLVWVLPFTILYSLYQKKIIYHIATCFYFLVGFIEIGHWVILKGPLSIAGLMQISNEGIAILEVKSSWVLLILIPYIFLFIIASRNPSKKNNATGKLFVQGIFSLIFFAFLLFVARTPGKYRYLPKIANVAIASVNEFRQYKKGVITPARVDAKSGSTEDQQIFVLILGESCSKNHMSLYGASRKTNPKLGSRNDIITYNNVVSPYSKTMECIPSILSQSNLENELSFDKSIDVLDIFHSAGYKTYWISNQSSVGIAYNPINSIAKKADYAKFLNISINSPLEAMSTRSYDSELFEPFMSVLKEQDSKKFIVLHLMGCHSGYTYRYPSGFDHYNGVSSKDKIIAEYDNTVLYNDHVVDSILSILKYKTTDNKNLAASAIYVSDHGENVYDEMNRVGHDYSKVIPKSNVEIPFVVWLSRGFKEQNNNKEMTIKINRDKPFLTDDLFHAIMDINHIQSPYFEKERSIFNEMFNDKRQRILIDGTDYDKK